MRGERPDRARSRRVARSPCGGRSDRHHVDEAERLEPVDRSGDRPGRDPDPPGQLARRDRSDQSSTSRHSQSVALRPASGAAARLCSVPSDPDRRASSISSSISLERFADGRRAIVSSIVDAFTHELDICRLNYPVIESFSVPLRRRPIVADSSWTYSSRREGRRNARWSARGGRRAGAGVGGGRLLRRLDHRGRPRSVSPPRPRRRALHVARARHGDRRGVRPQPDDARPHGLGPPGGSPAAGSSSDSVRRSSRTSPSGSRCRGATRQRECAS